MIYAIKRMAYLMLVVSTSAYGADDVQLVQKIARESKQQASEYQQEVMDYFEVQASKPSLKLREGRTCKPQTCGDRTENQVSSIRETVQEAEIIVFASF